MDSSLEAVIDTKECQVTYLGHSGWAVRTQNAVLIFDFVSNNPLINEQQNREAGAFVKNLKEEKVYAFVSHEHDDHYDKGILNWVNHIKTIHYIFGWRSEETSKFIEIGPTEDLKIDNIEISTIESTDDGVGFLVKIDGIVILHLGDHANWAYECDEFYKQQVDCLAKKCNAVDIVFIPVAKGSGARPASILEGAQYLVKELNARAVFPMHGGGKEYLYKEFAEEMKCHQSNSEVICASNPTNTWKLSFAQEKLVISNLI